MKETFCLEENGHTRQKIKFPPEENVFCFLSKRFQTEEGGRDKDLHTRATKT